MEKGEKPELLEKVKVKGSRDVLFLGLEKIEELSVFERLASQEPFKTLRKLNLQKKFEEYLSKGQISKAKETEAYASEKGIELEIKKGRLQKLFDECIAKGQIFKAEAIRVYASEKGIELEIKKELLQKLFDECIANGWISDAKVVEAYASEKGIELEIKKELLQKALDRYVAKGQISRAKKIVAYALEKGIELEIPLFEQWKKVDLGKVSLESIFYGYFIGNECKGMFVLGQDPITKELKFVFNATLKNCVDIGQKYGLKVIGGGWLKIDKENKIVVIGGRSEYFGYEPRMISAAVMVANFPDYEIRVQE